MKCVYNHPLKDLFLFSCLADTIACQRIWRDVTSNIVADDLDKADLAKQLIEAEQRTRIKGGAEEMDAPRRFFTYNKEADVWKWTGQTYSSLQKKKKAKKAKKARRSSGAGDNKPKALVVALGDE